MQTVNRPNWGLPTEVFGVLINLLLLAAYLVGDSNYSTLGFAKTGIAAIAETLFFAGLSAQGLAVVLRWKLRGSISRYVMMLVVTLWNQACLIAFFAALMPFRLK